MLSRASAAATEATAERAQPPVEACTEQHHQPSTAELEGCLRTTERQSKAGIGAEETAAPKEHLRRSKRRRGEMEGASDRSFQAEEGENSNIDAEQRNNSCKAEGIKEESDDQSTSKKRQKTEAADGLHPARLQEGVSKTAAPCSGLHAEATEGQDRSMCHHLAEANQVFFCTA